MNLEKYIIYSNSTILDALKKIEANNKGFICITDTKYKLQGVLTDGDLRRELIEHGNLNKSVSTFVKPNFTFLFDDADFNEIVEKFKDEKIIFLPVVSKDKKLKNILTKEQLHELLIKGEILNLQSDFEKYNQAEVFEVYNRPWGFYKTVVLSSFVQAKILHVFPHQKLSLQYHKKREEHWVVVKGKGMMIIGESIRDVKEGSYIFIPKGCKHRVENISKWEPLIISEVQLGDYFGEDDIIRIEDKYGRK